MTASTADDQRVRLDKWLWAARFYKTRSLAKEAIEGGKVHYNSQRCKPGKLVEAGAKLTLRLGWQEKVVIVDDISDRRRGAPEALPRDGRERQETRRNGLATKNHAGSATPSGQTPFKERPKGYPALPRTERPLNTF